MFSIKGAMKSLVRRYGAARRKVGRHASSSYERKQRDLVAGLSQAVQLLLAQRYREAAAQGRPLPTFREAEFRCFSQFGEDGILLFLFSVLETTNRRVIEMCAGDGVECNAANLIVNHGWEALLFDGNAAALAEGRTFYEDCPDTHIMPPELAPAWITAENVNEIVEKHGFVGEIDLFSLDMDGVDYWIWKALDRVSPRVVVLEYNNLWGPEESVTVPYAADFVSRGPQGASLGAFVKLGRKKGYRLVGCNRYGFNAFFVRRGLGETAFPEVTAASCLDNPFTARIQRRRGAQSPDEREWVKV
jgi:hypothetical protein